ncbi:MAG: HlyD family secretion protein [Clostridium sp.]|nr:HlyD family secretion protein [Acetatifactor muris]MCM1528361.1 HlyD family secretion protein [Bacteroides sp.]MCM1563576.1 HlyD family secretion protein [Clostridium sp.]
MRQTQKTKSEYLRKHTGIRAKRLKYDFLPAMLEIIERPENRVSDMIVILVLLLITSAVVWAAYAKVDIVVSGSGSIAPEGNVVSVTNVYGGEVEEILARDGDRIGKGDVMLTLDIREQEAELEQLQYELDILYVQREVYRKLRDYEEGGEQTDGGNAELEDAFEDSFGIDVEAYGDNRAIAEALIAEQQLFLLQTEEYELTRKNSEQKEIIDNQKESFVAQRNLTILQNINSLDIKIHETENNMEEMERAIEARQVTAPASGVVSNLQVNAAGQVIAAGQQLAYIIPGDAETLFIAYVRSADIEAVHVGDEVRVRITALDDTEYEIIAGKVKRIGDLALSANGIGSVYQVEISMEEAPAGIFHMGAEGSCDIIAGSRTVLDYFVEPLVKGLAESMHEK